VAKTPTFNVQQAIVSDSTPYIFDITILSATTSTVLVPNKDVQGCYLEGSQWANFLIVKIKVSNIGQTNYVVPTEKLELTDCGATSSFMNMYSVDFLGGPYFKFERCLSDTLEPKIFSCSNMGLSAGNFHIFTIWIEISDTVASTTGQSVIVNFLPLDVDLKTTSSPYPVTVTVPTSYHSTGLYRLTSDSTRDASWKVISLPSGTSFIAGENPFILDDYSTDWKPVSSATSGWIGLSYPNFYAVPYGEYEYQTTFSMPSSCTSLDVSFSVDDYLISVVVSDGTTSQTITSFSGNGFGGLSTFTATGLSAITTMTFTVSNSGGGGSGLLVQFGACR